MPTTAIIGPGAIGATVGAALLETGRHTVFFCGTRPFDRVHITFPLGAPPINLPADTHTTPADLHPTTVSYPDWILLCVKVHQTPSTAPWFRALLGPSTRVAVLQNGVEHADTVRPFLSDSDRILPVVVQIPAQLTAPGAVTLPAPPNLVVPATPLAQDFAQLFIGSRIPVQLTPDFVSSLWRKLSLNAVNGSLTALTAQPEIILLDPLVADLARGIAREALAVARAEGAHLPDTLPDDILAHLTAAPDLATRGNSMYYDRLAGRPVEAAARNGVIARLGWKHGIPTPINATLFALLQTFGKPRTFPLISPIDVVVGRGV